MKILHVIDNLSMGGAQSLLLELVPIQKKMGHQVSILQLKDSKDSTLKEKIRSFGVDVWELSTTISEYNPINSIKLIPYIRKSDVVHVHLFPALYWAGLGKLLSFSNVSLIYTEHSTQNKRREKALLHYMDKFIYSCCYKEIVACSSKALETFKGYFPKVNASSIPNGVNIQKYIDAEPYSKMELCNVAEDVFLLTMVARFAYPKRQDTIVEAISKLPDNFHAVLVGGDGGKMEDVKKLAKSLQIENRIHFLGVRPDVPRILKTSDVIIVSSEYEGLSLSSIEGMACGHPFVATNVNGLKEVVKDAGILFTCGDSDKLAEIIKRISTDRHFANSIINNCKVRAMKYDIKQVAAQYQSLYDRYKLK